MKQILVLGAGKSATHLIAYLLQHAEHENWKVLLADAQYEAAARKIGDHPHGEAMELDIMNEVARREQITYSDIVISMLPPTFHGKVAEDCVAAGKHLLTASYVDEHLRSLEKQVIKKDLLFLCEMGLDPGIDHMSAMHMIDDIRARGGHITSFRSHCGGLVAPESDDNPWHYKISWNPRNIIMAGKAGAHYREDGREVHLSHAGLFAGNRKVYVPGPGELGWYPNRDSLSYESLYGLTNTPGFVRTTLRHPLFMQGWKKIIELGLTEESPVYPAKGKTMAWLWEHHLEQRGLKEQLNAWLAEDSVFNDQFEWLNFTDSTWQLSRDGYSPADLLQAAVEVRLALLRDDKDMIVMLHELEYVVDDKPEKWSARLIVKGEDNVRTAMSKTVGLPLGIACRLILNETIKEKGLHIPVTREIYEPVLKELEEYGVAFEHWKE